MQTETTFQPLPQRKRRFVFPLCSAVIPGAGDILAGRSTSSLRLRGILLWGLAVLLLWALTSGGLCHFYWVSRLARFCFVLNLVSAVMTYKSLYPDFAKERFFALPLFGLFLATIFLGQSIYSGFIYSYGIRDYQVPSTGFQPTILNGENIWCDESIKARNLIHPGEVVTINYRGVTYVKRLIAFGGDEVLSLDGRLQVNGRALNVPFYLTDMESEQAPRSFGPVQVPPGTIFVIGDNRDVSLDSRDKDFGFPPVSCLRGKVLFIRASPDRKRNGIYIH